MGLAAPIELMRSSAHRQGLVVLLLLNVREVLPRRRQGGEKRAIRPLRREGGSRFGSALARR